MRRAKKQKLLCALLTVIMTVGMLPVTVFAQDGFPPQEENTSIVEPPQADPLPVDTLPEDSQNTSSPAEDLPTDEPEAEEIPVEESLDDLFSDESAAGESSSEKAEDNDCKNDSVTIRKVNENGEELTGAVFTIYPDADCDANSAIKTFPAGTYTLSTADSDLKSLMPSAGTDTSLYLKETTAPAGYEKETAVYLITIHADEDDASSSLVYTMTIGDDHKKELTVVNSPLSVASEAEEAVTPELMPSSRSLRNLNPDQGSILIPFVKKWSGDGDFSAARPDSITISLYKYLGTSFDVSTAIRVASRTLSPANAWSCEFDISNEPLYSGTAAYKWAVAEDAVAGYTETAHTDPAVVFNPPEVAGEGWNRITPCSEINITTSGNEKSIVCAKKGNTYIIWSVDPLSAAERQLVFQSAAAGIQGIGNPQYGAFTFISGFGTSSEFGLTVTESQVQFNNPSNWSFFATGIYNKSSAQTHASSITNSYTPVSAALAIPVTKIINGIPAATGTFTFILTGNTPGAPMPETGGETLTVTGSATGTFGNITYTAPGTWTYSVNETTGTEAGYSYDPTVYLITVTVTDTNGVLSAVPSFQTTAGDPADRITFTNTYSAGDLIVKKTTAGNAPIAGKEFRFTVTLSDSSINGSYGGMTFTNGAASFTLKDGEEMKAENLPNGVSFVVTEADYTGDGYVTQKTGDTGTILGNGELTASFTNTRNLASPDPGYGNLMIKKTVSGNLADYGASFSFTIVIHAEGTFTYTGSKSGTVKSGDTISLKHGESITIGGLPAGTAYSVTESGNTGYLVHASGNAGTIAANHTSIAAFTNKKYQVPYTADKSKPPLRFDIARLSGLGIILLLVLSQRKRNA